MFILILFTDNNKDELSNIYPLILLITNVILLINQKDILEWL